MKNATAPELDRVKGSIFRASKILTADRSLPSMADLDALRDELHEHIVRLAPELASEDQKPADALAATRAALAYQPTHEPLPVAVHVYVLGEICETLLRQRPAPGALPGPGFLSGCTTSTWIDVTPVGRTAWLLVGHPPPRRPTETAASIEAGLRAMASSLGLRPVADRVPSIGSRIRIRSGIVALDYGHDHYLLRVSNISQEWKEHLGRGGQALLAVGLDPLPVGQGQAAVELYLQEATARQRILMGAAAAR
ncbi:MULTISPECIES: DUF6415 family natural product biosynthesis protein [unclassified Streptomyces]|uniref:DUF6415 family natural product biosynthesis protein n=1 Tax=unclassified Streptomyces TaxID=2593676 RepID=UPI002E785A3B|nr:DUF6415 family natural product biosynthesis protein [Streptomyces sp. JV176]MEE1802951.1 DUF6415 family natural product biosynthesis protein [Streptomyces sp. JV176]